MGLDSYDPAHPVVTFDNETEFDVNNIVKGRVLHILGDEVVVDVGYKSEGSSPSRNGKMKGWTRSSRPSPAMRSSSSSNRSRMIGGHRPVLSQGQTAKGMGRHHRQAQGRRRRLRPGHAQDQGRLARQHRRQRLSARLAGRYPPAPDIGDYIGRNIDCKILKIDEQRRNIVVSRRKLIEDERTERRPSSCRDRGRPDSQGNRQEHRRVRRLRGLGGIDGLLHITAT